MQELFSAVLYDALMEKKTRLRRLREATGMSLNELARQINESPTNVSFWERTGTLPRSNTLIPMAKTLGITVEELLGEDRPKRVVTPGGRMRTLFDAASKLPRRQQQRIADVIEDMLVARSHHKAA